MRTAMCCMMKRRMRLADLRTLDKKRLNSLSSSKKSMLDPDSIMKKIMAPVEYCLKLKADNTAQATGYRRNTSRNQSPAVYPDIHRYTEWRLFNGRLILHADTIAGFTQEGEVPVTDTADIVVLRRDTLILRFGDKEQSYYRKIVKK